MSILTHEPNNEYQLSLSSSTELRINNTTNISPRRATPYVSLGPSPYQVRIISTFSDLSQNT
jgi:hypothetical protein